MFWRRPPAWQRLQQRAHAALADARHGEALALARDARARLLNAASVADDVREDADAALETIILTARAALFERSLDDLRHADDADTEVVRARALRLATSREDRVRVKAATGEPVSAHGLVDALNLLVPDVVAEVRRAADEHVETVQLRRFDPEVAGVVHDLGWSIDHVFTSGPLSVALDTADARSAHRRRTRSADDAPDDIGQARFRPLGTEDTADAVALLATAIDPRSWPAAFGSVAGHLGATREILDAGIDAGTLPSGGLWIDDALVAWIAAYPGDARNLWTVDLAVHEAWRGRGLAWRGYAWLCRALRDARQGGEPWTELRVGGALGHHPAPAHCAVAMGRRIDHVVVVAGPRRPALERALAPLVRHDPGALAIDA